MPSRPAARRALRAGAAVLAFVAVAGGLNLAVAGSGLAQEEPAEDVPDQGLVAEGARLYGANCATCHGEQGRGITREVQPDSYGPSLQGVGPAAFDFMIRTGRMPLRNPDDPVRHRAQQMTDAEREAIVAWSRTLPGDGGAEIPEIGDWETADVSEGLALFTSNCAACHGPTAAGIAVGQRDVSSNLDQATPLEIAEAIRTGPGVMPLFGEDVMSEEQLASVVRWVVELRDRDSPGGISIGRSGPVSEGFVAWVLGIGVLSIVMYVLGEKAGSDDEHA